MHEIRNDNSVEKEILKIEFKKNIIFLILSVFFFIMGIFILVLALATGNFFDSPIPLIFILFFIIFGIAFIPAYRMWNKQEVTITNKRIKGRVYKTLGSGRTQRVNLFNISMRIDQIDEISSTGSNLHITFVSGYNNSKEKEITLIGVKNTQEVQEKLEELMVESKNSTDLQFEIEAKKLELEREKIEALKNLKN